MEVAKFGGSSLSNSAQIKKVGEIIRKNKNIKCVVVSAPGKRTDDDIKITDLLITLYKNKMYKQNTSNVLNKIIERFSEMCKSLKLSKHLPEKFRDTLIHLMDTLDDDYLLDALKSSGERFNAKVLAEYLRTIGVEARYMSPKHAGIFLTDTPGSGTLLDKSYKEIEEKLDVPGIVVIPGFYGYSKSGNIITFKRGGSDITGAIVARGIHAAKYLNYTDQSFILRADPRIVDNPEPIEELTYLEMRTLSYAGFDIFHEEALEPIYHCDIPVIIKNTNQPDYGGTKILRTRKLKPKGLVTGFASKKGFINISINKYMMDRDTTYLRKLLKIFEDYNIHIDHLPTSVDNISFFINEKNFDSPEHILEIIKEIKTKLNPDNITLQENIAIIYAAGEGMNNTIGSIYMLTHALSKENINIIMTMSGAHESSIIFAVAEIDEKRAIQSLYNTLFKP